MGERELDDESVLRADPLADGSWSVTRVTFDTSNPNGLLVSADERTLYVSQCDYSVTRPRELRAYPIQDDGSLGLYSVLHEFGKDYRGVHRAIDGMCLDEDGNIIATAGWRLSGPGPLIYVFSPSGRVLETHPVPVDRPTNCTFGDDDLRTLYVTTAQGHLFRVSTARRGLALPRLSMYP
jgi:gluconolactonase